MIKNGYNFHWYVLYTYPNSEKKVQKYLCKSQIESFLPLQKSIRHWSDRKKIIQVPLFPNYVFVNTVRVERYKALQVPGVVRYISYENEPVVISRDEIDAIKKILEGGECFTRESQLEKGDLVRVTQGPFLGIIGRFNEKKGKKKLYINVPSIGQSISIEISLSNIEKL